MIDHPVLGYRIWKSVRNDGSARTNVPPGLLRGIFYMNPWERGDNQAVCINKTSPLNNVHAWSLPRIFNHLPSEPVPGPRCDCGFNGLHTLQHLQDKAFYAPVIGSLEINKVVGLVKGWGNGYLAPNGWRTEYAEIKAFISGLGDTDLIVYASKYYKVPVIPLESIDLVAQEFGRFVPKDKWPAKLKEKDKHV